MTGFHLYGTMPRPSTGPGKKSALKKMMIGWMGGWMGGQTDGRVDRWKDGVFCSLNIVKEVKV